MSRPPPPLPTEEELIFLGRAMAERFMGGGGHEVLNHLMLIGPIATPLALRVMLNLKSESARLFLINNLAARINVCNPGTRAQREAFRKLLNQAAAE